MKISTNKKTLVTALSRIQGIIEKTSLKPITANALIETTEKGFSVSATDLQIGMKAFYKDASIVKTGKISVNARKMYEIVKELPDKEIVIQEKNNFKIEISCGKSLSFSVVGLPPEEFPDFFEEKEKDFVRWETKKFLNALLLTSFSISRDETKKNIAGAYIENLEGNRIRIVTTDGYRLSIVDEFLGKQQEGNEGIIIPNKAVTEINKILHEKQEEKEFSVFVEKSSLHIKIAEVEMFIRLIEKKFPEYRAIIPGEAEEKVKIVLEKEKIKPSIRRMAIISQEKSRPVVFSFGDRQLVIHTEDSDIGNAKETIPLKEKSVETFTFCINSLYIMDVLQVLDDDICIEYNHKEENKPIFITPVKRKEEAKYIIMPMIMD